MRVVLGGVALGLAGVTAGNLLFRDRTPPLLQNLDSIYAKATEQLTARVQARFPVGTAESNVTTVLAGEGFTIDSSERTASWKRSGIVCFEIARIWWSADNGKITRIEGLRNAICP